MHRLIARLRTPWQSAKSSLWFLPAVFVVVAIGLSYGLLWIDRTYADFITTQLPWLFGGTPSAARSLLSTIAASVITVVSIAFSLTIVAIQQASAYYTPRLLRTFTSHPGNQVVLGAYVATFVYALLILRAVREDENGTGGFVPSVSASMAILLALICMGLLVYFINHIATSLQATTVISRVHREAVKVIKQLHPDPIGGPATRDEDIRPEAELHYQVSSVQGGFVASVDEDTLGEFEYARGTEVHIRHKVGDFVAYGDILADVAGSERPDEQLADQIRRSVMLVGQRSGTVQDPLFSFRQLVDTALKGLSPGINDVTTAGYCVRYLGDALALLAGRQFPSGARRLQNGRATLFVRKPTWDDFVLESFSQILRNSTDKAEMLELVIRTLHRLAEQLPNQQRAEPLRTVLQDCSEILAGQPHLASDRGRLEDAIAVANKTLDEVPLERDVV